MVAPFPWFGGKRRVVDVVWPRFGSVVNYVEPFAGSLAMLLGRPIGWTGTETVNDKDGFIANFWRALAADPQGVAQAADWPVNENDQHARHVWLVSQRAALTARLEGDATYYDVQIAGWWVWGIGVWIGAGWCAGDGPWSVDDAGQLVHLGDAGRGVHRQRVHLGDAGQGVHRKLVHLGDAGQGVHRKLVHLGDAGQGVHRKRVHLGDAGQGEDGLLSWMQALATRLRRVRVCCGDWRRVCGPTPTVKQGLTGVFLDPPYGDEADRQDDLYAVDDGGVAADVRTWALGHGGDDQLRIALCGYSGEHEMPGWVAVPWKAHGGYGSQGDGRGRENAAREVIWFSPSCLGAREPTLFDGLDVEALA
jgi:hypothetical protein